MPLDIYTLAPIATPSREHVFPDSLGGRLAVRGLLDKHTNDALLGGTVDATLERGLRAIRLMVDARSGDDGKPPAALTGLESNGRYYDVAPDDRVVVRRGGHATWSGKTLTLDAWAADLKGLKKMLKKGAEKAGVDANLLMQRISGLARQCREPSPQLEFQLDVWSQEALRATAKIACNLFARSHADVFVSRAFDAIRTYVIEGRCDDEPVVVADVDAIEGLAGPFDHLVRVATTATGELQALVVYFGCLAFVVNMGLVPPGFQWSSAYRVDSLARKDPRDDADDLAIAIPSFAACASLADEHAAELILRQGSRLIDAATDRQEQLWLRRIVEKHMRRDAKNRPAGQVPTLDEWRTLANDIVADVVADLRPAMVAAANARRAAAYEELRHGHEEAATPPTDAPLPTR